MLYDDKYELRDHDGWSSRGRLVLSRCDSEAINNHPNVKNRGLDLKTEKVFTSLVYPNKSEEVGGC